MPVPESKTIVDEDVVAGLYKPHEFDFLKEDLDLLEFDPTVIDDWDKMDTVVKTCSGLCAVDEGSFLGELVVESKFWEWYESLGKDVKPNRPYSDVDFPSLIFSDLLKDYLATFDELKEVRSKIGWDPKAPSDDQRLALRFLHPRNVEKTVLARDTDLMLLLVWSGAGIQKFHRFEPDSYVKSPPGPFETHSSIVHFMEEIGWVEGIRCLQKVMPRFVKNNLDEDTVVSNIVRIEYGDESNATKLWFKIGDEIGVDYEKYLDSSGHLRG